jgi:uncharacterized Zn ribbon protein
LFYGGCAYTIHSGTVAKTIRLTDDKKEMECEIGGSVKILKTGFLKKA